MIYDRRTLINFLQETLDRSPLRALLHHSELLGGFDPMIGSRPGWIVRITSETGKQWLIGVTPEPAKKFRVWYLNEVHWENWVGCLYKGELHNGDHPDEYCELCETAKLLRDKTLGGSGNGS